MEILTTIVLLVVAFSFAFMAFDASRNFRFPGQRSSPRDTKKTARP